MIEKNDLPAKLEGTILFLVQFRRVYGPTFDHVCSALQMRSFKAPAFLATHWINAFESEHGRHLHLDACVTSDPRLMGHWNLATVRSGALGGKQIECSVLRRLTLDMEAPDGKLGFFPLELSTPRAQGGSLEVGFQTADGLLL